MSNLVSWSTVTGLWIAWLIYWFLSALRVRRNERGESVGQRLLTTLVLVVGAYLIFAPVTPFGPLNTRFIPEAFGIRAVALTMIVAGSAGNCNLLCGPLAEGAERRNATGHAVRPCV